MYTIQFQNIENLTHLTLESFNYDIRKNGSFLYITLRFSIPLELALSSIQNLISNLNEVVVVEVKDNFIPILNLYDAIIDTIALLSVNKSNWLNITFKRKE